MLNYQRVSEKKYIHQHCKIYLCIIGSAPLSAPRQFWSICPWELKQASHRGVWLVEFLMFGQNSRNLVDVLVGKIPISDDLHDVSCLLLLRSQWSQCLMNNPQFSMFESSLVGGLEHLFYFSIQLGMSSSQLTNSIIFQRGRAQPPTSQ